MITVTSVEAQNRFGQLLDTVQREPVSITRHGRTAAFMVSPKDMQDLQALHEVAKRNKQTATAAFADYFAKSDAELKPAAHALSTAEIVRMVKASRG
jgi:antitoxin Phd